MINYADTGFIGSLFLLEGTTSAARAAAAKLDAPLALTPLATLEFRNTLNLAIIRQRIDRAQRDGLWQQFEAQISAG